MSVRNHLHFNNTILVTSHVDDKITGMDIEKLQSDEYQRVYQYLNRYRNNDNLDSYSFNKYDVMNTPQRAIQVISL